MIQAAQKLGWVLNLQGPTRSQAKWSDWRGLPVMDQIWETVRTTPGNNASVAIFWNAGACRR